MIRRRKFLAASGLAAAAFPFISRGADKPALRLGLIADPQYADVDPLATRYYRKSIGKLTEAVEHFNGLELDFCVNVGDMIDQKWESFDAIMKPLTKSRHKFYHLLGNHDFELPDDEKARAVRRLGLTDRYYSVRQNGFCFAMLDTNDVSLYAHQIDSKEFAAAYTTLQKFAATGLIYAQPWNGAVGDPQIQWLEETCRTAAKANEKVIVFAHHPVYPLTSNHNEWNSEGMLKVVERNRNIVAWINGHNHAGAFGVYADVPFVTLRGMVETENTNSYATARLFNDRLELTGAGREISRELPFRKIV